MKKYYLLGAFVFIAFLTSCENSDQQYDELKTLNSQKAKFEDNENSYKTYHSVVASFEYDKNEDYKYNLLQFEKHVNSLVDPDEYKEIDFKQLEFLEKVDVEYVKQLNYSLELKTALNDLILFDDFNSSEKISDKEEIILFQNVSSLHISDDGFDRLNRDRRTIAFAYGSQFSVKEAILYAGVLEFVKYK